MELEEEEEELGQLGQLGGEEEEDPPARTC